MQKFKKKNQHKFQLIFYIVITFSRRSIYVDKIVYVLKTIFFVRCFHSITWNITFVIYKQKYSHSIVLMQVQVFNFLLIFSDIFVNKNM